MDEWMNEPLLCKLSAQPRCLLLDLQDSKSRLSSTNIYPTQDTSYDFSLPKEKYYCIGKLPSVLSPSLFPSPSQFLWNKMNSKQRMLNEAWVSPRARCPDQFGFDEKQCGRVFMDHCHWEHVQQGSVHTGGSHTIPVHSLQPSQQRKRGSRTESTTDHPVPVINRIPRSWVCQGREAEEEQKGGSGFLYNAFI